LPILPILWTTKIFGDVLTTLAPSALTPLVGQTRNKIPVRWSWDRSTWNKPDSKDDTGQMGYCGTVGGAT